MERLWLKHQFFLMAAGVVLSTLFFSVTGLGSRSHTRVAFWPVCLGSMAVAAGADRALRRKRMCTPERVRACREASRHLAGLAEAAVEARRAAGYRDSFSVGHGFHDGEPVLIVTGDFPTSLPGTFRGFPVIRKGR